MGRPDFDERDGLILQGREAKHAQRTGPRVGDFVEFADGVVHRIAHLYPDGHLQTAHVNASYYLGGEGVSMSGSLYVGLPGEALTDTGRVRPGRVWFFHHDLPRAHHGVDVEMACRVYSCGRAAPTV